MTEIVKNPIPTTFDLLQRIKRPRIVGRFERAENYFLGAVLCLGLVILGVWGMSAGDWISRATTEILVVASVFAMVLVVAFWGATQVIEGVIAWKAGYRPIVERIDDAISKEAHLIGELARCDPKELRERSKHLELEAKVLGRRAGLFSVTGAIAVVLVNLFDTAERAKIWVEFPEARFVVYTGSLGILIGSLLLAILVGKLERISGLLNLAASRLD